MRRESARERRDNKKSRKNMQVLTGVFGVAVNAWITKKVDPVDVNAVTRMLESSSDDSGSSSSSEESLSSISSNDSPPYRRKKEKALKKKSKKAN